MRRVIFCFLNLLFFCFSVLAQQVQFQRVYGGDGYDAGCEIIQTDDGYLIAGTSGSFDFGQNSQVVLLKTDVQGYVQWSRTYGTQFSDRAESMSLTSDGFLLIGGYAETIDNSYQVKVWKLTVEGDTIWSREFGGSDWDLGKQMVALPDGGCVILGQTYSYGNGNGDFYLIRLDSEGDSLWTKTYGGDGDESGEAIALAADGGFFLAGVSESFGSGGKDMYVVRTNPDGDTLWTKTFGGTEDDFCFGVAATDDDGYVIVGGTFSHTPGKSDFVIRKEDGNIQWVRYESKPGDNFLTDVIIEPGTGWVTVTGYGTEGTDYGAEDVRILRYDAANSWNGVAKFHGSEGNDRAFDIKRTSDGGYVMVGVTSGFLERFDDIYVIKTDSIGFSIPPTLGVNEVNLDGRTFEVSVGPNPISNNTTLFIQNFDVLQRKLDGAVRFEIYNSVGQLMHSVSVESQSQSLSNLNFASGLYFYQLIGENRTLATGKLIRSN